MKKEIKRNPPQKENKYGAPKFLFFGKTTHSKTRVNIMNNLGKLNVFTKLEDNMSKIVMIYRGWF